MGQDLKRTTTYVEVRCNWKRDGDGLERRLFTIYFGGQGEILKILSKMLGMEEGEGN